MPNGQTLDYILEELIDKKRLWVVLMAIAFVCDEKAAHIRETWQDEITALAWEKQARKIETIANACKRIDL